MAGKIIWAALRALLTIGACLAGGYVLQKFEYCKNFAAIDNISGMLPVFLLTMAGGGFTFLLWMKHTRRFLPFSAVLALFVILSVALFPTAVRKDWWINTQSASGADDRPDLTLYTPFSPNSQTASLAEKSTLKLAGDLPRLDGATALYPLYAAFAEAVYDEKAFSPDTVVCTTTRQAYTSIIHGERDVIFVAAPSEGQLAEAARAGADLRFTPIGREAFVFVAGRDNPIGSLSVQDLRNIFSGKSAHWRTFGWPEGGPILAFMRPEGSGSQTGLRHMLMRGLPVQAPQPLPEKGLIISNSLVKQVGLHWRGVQPGLGYSFRYFASAMYANPEVKLLKVNGVAPSLENIRNGSYPLSGTFFAVTLGEPAGNAKLFIEWIKSPQGRDLLEKTGYTALADFP